MKEDNSVYGYPNNKITTQNLINKGVYFAKLTVGKTESPLNSTFNFLVDTGSSWNWVHSCNPDKFAFWTNHTCPYFRVNESSTLECSEERKYIQYGSGEVEGPICQEDLLVYGTDDMEAHMPMILHEMPRGFKRKGFVTYDGILGLSPDDESAGPLYINYLYQQDKIQEKKFSILPSPLPFLSAKITFGGY